MARNLIYQSIFIHLFRGISYILLKVLGYRFVGTIPTEKKLLAVAAPHTSNWDFPIFIAMVFTQRLEPRFMGKDTLFKGFFGRFMYWCGGFPVERKGGKAKDAIQTAVDLYKTHDDLLFGIAPEGTRSKVSKWKTGFYRIAVEADVPILLAYLDAEKKIVGLRDELFYPTGDMDKDMAEIQAFYADKVGIKPENQISLDMR